MARKASAGIAITTRSYRGRGSSPAPTGGDMFYEKSEQTFGALAVPVVEIGVGRMKFTAGVIGAGVIGAGERTFGVSHADRDNVWRTFVGTPPKCRDWLATQGLNPLAAGLLLGLAEADAAANAAPALEDQHRAGGVHEEIGKLVDGVVEDIRNGHIPYRRIADSSLWIAAGQSRYAVDPFYREALVLTAPALCAKYFGEYLAALVVRDMAAARLKVTPEYRNLKETA